MPKPTTINQSKMRAAYIALLLPRTVAFTTRPFSSVSFLVGRQHSILSMSEQPENEEKFGFTQEVMDEANEALTAVGWASPSNDAELTSDDPFVRSIDASIQADVGVSLDELLNPAKVRIHEKRNKIIGKRLSSKIGGQFGERLVQPAI